MGLFISLSFETEMVADIAFNNVNVAYIAFKKINHTGVLIVKKRFFENQPPTEPGGGSVFFVSSSSHRYLKDTETREEAGTPDIVGCIRAGCTLKLINDIGAHYIFQCV